VQNHFLFTPLLPSTTVGTLEYRAIEEPSRGIKGVHYYQAEATALDPVVKEARVVSWMLLQHCLQYGIATYVLESRRNICGPS
jgi:NADH dehydrogenase FAD-containing subunit